jgi:tRNA(His) guanylyltransferase
MKAYYEDRMRIFLPRRTYTIIRVDGKAFHTYTKGLKEPFDEGLAEDMDLTACYLCKNIQGAKFAFVQSDEISILLTDFDKIDTDAWFDGNIQKMASIAAGLATAEFNRLRLRRKFNTTIATAGTILDLFKMATFDARVFTIPCDYEVENYFIWRQKDATKNSISSVALSLYSHRELEGKNGDQKQEMIFQKGINWNDYAPKYKRGRIIFKQEFEVEVSPKNYNQDKKTTVMRTRWAANDCPIFTQNREFLLKYIPKNN